MKRNGIWSILAFILIAALLAGCTSEAEKYEKQMAEAVETGDYQTAITLLEEHRWLFDDAEQLAGYYTARQYEEAGEYEIACFIYEYLTPECQDSVERAAAIGEKIPVYRLMFDEIRTNRVLEGSSYDTLWVGNVPFEIWAHYGEKVSSEYVVGEGPYIYSFAGKKGLINADGTAAHPAVWEEIRKEGDYFVAGGKTYSETVLNRDGTRAIDKKWHSVKGISEDGMVLFFSSQDGKDSKDGYGYADLTTGTELEGRWFDGQVFTEGMAAVRENAGRDAETKQPIGKWGYIDRTGKLITAYEYDEALPFSEGLAAVKKDGKWGYIDYTGAVVIPFEFDKAESFKNGYAEMTKNGITNKVSRTGVVAEEATTELGGERKIVHQFKDGMVIFRDGMFVYDYGVMDAAGNVVIEAEWDSIDDYYYSEGIFRVGKDFDYGFIDASGKMISEPKWDWARRFEKGYAVVEVSNYPAENTAGVIDAQGNVVVNPVYDEVHVYGDDIAGARKGDVWYIIDMKTGVVSEGFEDGEYITAGVARIRKTDAWGEETCGLYDVVNERLITAAQWDSATGANQGYCMVEQNDKYALIDKDGKIITDFQEPISTIKKAEQD